MADFETMGTPVSILTDVFFFGLDLLGEGFKVLDFFLLCQNLCVQICFGSRLNPSSTPNRIIIG